MNKRLGPFLLDLRFLRWSGFLSSSGTRFVAATACGVLVYFFLFPVFAQAAPAPGSAFFESKIRPILADHCYECHSAEAGKSKGGLRVDDRDSLLRGGDTGPAVVPGKPGESLLLVSMEHSDPDLVMPPEKPRLSDAVLEDFRKWITEGAADPRESVAGKDGKPVDDFEARKQHWSYQPLERSKVPVTKTSGWAINEIDHFILDKLEKHGLEPSPDASPEVLQRRLAFDLTGLPPQALDSDAPWEERVDSLLNSPAFGPRWARHWLDVVRYAESNGKEANLLYPHAWRYRDYVIDAFTNDLPYDRFLMEQIAGDLLSAKNDAERARLLIATGFLAIGAKNLALQNPEQFAADLYDEQIDALSRGFLAISFACARCHDHKADPVTMGDYYGLVGIFQSTDTRYGTWIDSENNQGGRLQRLPAVPGQIIPTLSLTKEEVTSLRARLAQLDKDQAALESKMEKAKKAGTDSQKLFNDALREALRIYWSRGPLAGRLDTVDANGKALPLCMAAVEADTMADSPRYERGNLTHPAGRVPRGVPSLFGLANEGAAPEKSSGRLELAHWIADPKNPLTARVMVNRVWSHLFGVGLVDTVDDFGRFGAKPSHPELLDWLALRFQEKGWSVKSLIREIVLSRTYQQSSEWRDLAYEADPGNRMLWRMNKRRLEAEAIRDAMLAASGELDLRPGRASLVATLGNQSAGMVPSNPALPKDLDGSVHRSIYLPILRDQLPEVLRQFDFAEPSLVVGQRDVTNAPAQALYLINSSFVRERSAAVAKRVLKVAPDESRRIDAAFRFCLGRAPDVREVELVTQFLAQSLGGAEAKSAASDKEKSEQAWQDMCQTLLASADFRMID